MIHSTKYVFLCIFLVALTFCSYGQYMAIVDAGSSSSKVHFYATKDNGVNDQLNIAKTVNNTALDWALGVAVLKFLSWKPHAH